MISMLFLAALRPFSLHSSQKKTKLWISADYVTLPFNIAVIQWQLPSPPPPHRARSFLLILIPVSHSLRVVLRLLFFLVVMEVSPLTSWSLNSLGFFPPLIFYSTLTHYFLLMVTLETLSSAIIKSFPNPTLLPLTLLTISILSSSFLLYPHRNKFLTLWGPLMVMTLQPFNNFQLFMSSQPSLSTLNSLIHTTPL